MGKFELRCISPFFSSKLELELREWQAVGYMSSVNYRIDNDQGYIVQIQNIKESGVSSSGGVDGFMEFSIDSEIKKEMNP